MTRYAYLCLENPSVVKDKETRGVIFDLIGTLVHKFNHGLGVYAWNQYGLTPSWTIFSIFQPFSSSTALIRCRHFHCASAATL